MALGAKAQPNTPKTGKRPLHLTLLIWIITAIVGAFIFANIKPYEVIASNFFGGIRYEFITNVLYNIPLLGGIFRLIGGLFTFGAGFLLWAFVQLLELLPLLLFGHGTFLENSINRSGGKRFGINKNDHWEVKTVKRIGNSLNTETLRFLIILGVAVYSLDFFLCLMVFSPVKGGTTADLGMILQTGQYSKIDWWNIWKAVATVGAVEFLVKLRLIFVQVADDLRD